MPKYKKWYDSIISNALSENRQRGDIYYEEHHIMPRSLGGSDDPQNLVLLTAKEHYVCHLLLTKFSTGQQKYKMASALSCMTFPKSGIQKRYTSRMYGYSRKLMKENNPMYDPEVRKRHKQVMNSKEYKENMSKILKGKFTGEDHWLTTQKYNTPFGVFHSKREMIKNSPIKVATNTLYNWCKKCDRKITSRSVLSGLFVKDDIGKTFREVGYYIS